MALVHVDTDSGGDPDDLCAIVMLLGWPGVELAGVTTSPDEGGTRAGLASYALRLAGRGDVPVAAGAQGSIGGLRVTPGFPDLSLHWPEPVEAFSVAPRELVGRSSSSDQAHAFLAHPDVDLAQRRIS